MIRSFDIRRITVIPLMVLFVIITPGPGRASAADTDPNRREDTITSSYVSEHGKLSVSRYSNPGSQRSHELFKSLLADPKELSSHISFVHVNSSGSAPQNFNGAFIGLSVYYPLYANVADDSQTGWKVGLTSAVFSQFNIDRSSDDLMNTDYLVGFPLEYKNNNLAARIRLMHQSSHIGDEFLLSDQAPKRVNLSLEFLDVLLAKTVNSFRVYAGGKYAFRRSPANLEPGTIQFGFEYRKPTYLLGGKPIVGLDYKAYEVTGWDPGISMVAGFYYPRFGPTLRGLHFLLKAYEGPAPFGQFYTRRINYFGFGVYLSL